MRKKQCKHRKWSGEDDDQHQLGGPLEDQNKIQRQKERKLRGDQRREEGFGWRQGEKRWMRKQLWSQRTLRGDMGLRLSTNRRRVGGSPLRGWVQLRSKIFTIDALYFYFTLDIHTQQFVIITTMLIASYSIITKVQANMKLSLQLLLHCCALTYRAIFQYSLVNPVEQ